MATVTLTDHHQSLKEALVESLTAILSPDHNVRVNGEDQVKALEVTEEIRKILPMGLNESISKVRSSVAYAISAIANTDWPEAWPDLFQILMQALTSGDTNAVHGAMRVLAEFTQDITDVQMVHVAPVILPEMYKIFLQHEVFSIRTRSRAVSIFNICAGMIATMAELKRALLVPDGPASDSGLKMEIMKNLVYAVFEFIHALLDIGKFKGLVKKSINEILYYAIVYMQITEDQARMWTSNPDQFVEDEDDDTFSYSVRISAQDLLMLIGQEFELESALGLCAAITRHLQEAETQKQHHENWWKVHESCMLALGTVCNLVMETVKSGTVQFDISAFLQNVVLTDLNLTVSPFLIGRCLWTASRYAEGMNQDLLQRCLQATVGGIHPSQHPVIRISAIRAVYSYCEFLKESGSSQMLVPFLPNITEGLIAVATQFSSDVLSLSVFLKYSSDPVITSIVQDLFKELAVNDTCMLPLQQRLLPTLVSILQAEEGKVALGLPSVALDILTTIARASKAPISDQLLGAFPAAVYCTLNTDDNATMQSGGECIRAFASVAMDQIVHWHDEQVISKLLDPKTSQFTASFVGRLVTVVLSKSLLMIFARLMHDQMEAVLEFLTSVPDPMGKPALEFVLKEWVVAMVKLLQHIVSTNDSRLKDIVVEGDEIISASGNGIRTRSKAKVEWTTVPVVVKIYKLLINELNNQIESSQSAAQNDSQEDEEEGWEDEEEEGAGDVQLSGQTLSSLLDEFAGELSTFIDDAEDEEDDPDALLDPVNNVNLLPFLTEFLQSLSQQPYYGTFTAHHTDTEKQILHNININVLMNYADILHTTVLALGIFSFLQNCFCSLFVLTHAFTYFVAEYV
ncbi:IPO9-like protein [Mya arenaria]|uniref:IPO9-like protein n=1 Tax=Mya arenaria TaxID=6604 RepID=A0ABY7FVL8_MYAAR|nr:IPO9-like protein [Mya arenaria]